jgi:hypothetical protein
MRDGKGNRTEVDLRLGNFLAEAKLTETDFETAPLRMVQRYRDFEDVFETGRADTMMKTQTVITDSDTNPNVANPNVTRKIQYRHGMMRREDSRGVVTTASIADIANCETRGLRLP